MDKKPKWVNRTNRAGHEEWFLETGNARVGFYRTDGKWYGFYSNCFIKMPEGLTVEEMKRHVINCNVSRYSKGIAELMEVI